MLLMRLILILLLFFSIKSFSKNEQNVSLPMKCIKGQQLSNHFLDEHYQSGVFTLYYTLKGDDKLSDVSRVTSKSPPVRIIDIAKQLKSANQFYQQDVKLTFPLNQSIYKEIKHINVFIIDLKLNGSAFDKPAFETFSDGSTTKCGLRIMISNKLDPHVKQTPAHELFHLYQYGYAIFKQTWYLEGMARWMETTFKTDENVRVEVDKPFNCRSWYTKSYDAALFWQSVAHRYADVMVTTPQQYYSGQEPVFKKESFAGGGMVAPLLSKLSTTSREIALKNHRPIRDWSAAQRRQPRDNDTICRIVNQL